MLEKTIAHLGNLIAFPVISGDDNLAIVDYLQDRLEASGAVCWRNCDTSGTRANLFATLGPLDGRGILLSGHTDVVPVGRQNWTSEPFKMDRRAGQLFGRGTCDMKGFVAVCVALAETISPGDLTRPLHFAFSYDEETGCLGAQNLVRELAARHIRPEITIVGEPTQMRIIDGHKGCYEYAVEFTGLDGHGSAPERGVNAVECAVRYAARLLEMREKLKERAPAESRFDPPSTTLNIGRLRGGVATNVIAGQAHLDWEMRPVQDSDADFVKDALRDYTENDLLPAMRSVYPGANIETSVIGEVVGLDPQEKNAARDLLAELTGNDTANLVAFGTEAGLFQGLSSDVVVCGPGSIAQAHKPDEYIEIAELAKCCEVLAAVAATLSR